MLAEISCYHFSRYLNIFCMLVAQDYVQSMWGMCRAMSTFLCVGKHLLTEYNITTASSRAEMQEFSKYSLILPSCQVWPCPPCQTHGQVFRALPRQEMLHFLCSSPPWEGEINGCSKPIFDLHKPFWSDVIEDGSPGKTAGKFLFTSSAVSLVLIIIKIVLLRACVDW